MRVAKDYLSLPDNTQTHYYIQDANDFMNRKNKDRYDIIFSDLYSDDAMTPLQAKRSFLHSCADRLNDNGWLAGWLAGWSLIIIFPLTFPLHSHIYYTRFLKAFFTA
ncbi:hypothetical protein [Pantoea cypripedii]|uniref:hypothetical protein n=1 Tax=Pantoea cypripedii TaxID=55209 RepID=UPI000A102CCA|nr:hypothetical protein [Pantoea cypripedii]